MVVQRLLITGAAGRIGSVLRQGLRGEIEELRLADLEPLQPEAANERCVHVDLRDFAAVMRLLHGVDAIVHLAAIPHEAPFSEVLDHNIRVTSHLLEAARRHGVRRLVLASSNHVTGMYPAGQRIGPEVPARPDSFYGVGKVCDEALGRLYAEKFGLEVACLRIGSFLERPRDERALATWLSHRDAVELVRRCLTTPQLGFAILYGVSGNRRSWWDNPDAERLGYEPQDDAEAFAAEIHADPDAVRGPADAFQGGPFALPETSLFDTP